GGDEMRTESAGTVEILADGPLRGLALIIAHRPVVEAGIAGDIAERVGGANVPRPTAHHGDQLRLVVEFDRGPGPPHRLAMGDQRGGATQEEARIFRLGVTAFGGVVDIVEAETDDLSG